VKPGYWLIPLVLIVALAWLVGCSPAAPTGASSPASSPEPNPVEKAAAQATAMIQSAEATAMVLRAQAMATALVQNAGAAGATPAPTAMPLLTLKPTPSPDSTTLPTPSRLVGGGTPQGAATSQVRLVGVSIGTESDLILVQFKANPSVARKWRQGIVYVVEEATGAIYNEIPVLPVVGPLFGRPKDEDQIGYVMLVNAPSELRSGAIVTVVLGDFSQQHVTVK